MQSTNGPLGPAARDDYERMLAGEPYRPDDPRIVEAQLRGQRIMERFNATGVDDADLRRRLLGDLLGHVGEDTEIRPPLYVDYGAHLHVGARTFVNYGLVALDVAPITIGDDVQIATGVQLLTPTHPIDPARRRDKWEGAEPITIGDNVWLGGGVIVLPGVTIGADTVVGAGSVVVSDLPEGVVAVGNPARVVKHLRDDFRRSI
jgi:maltose O-acetyltransferase